ncbi:hypothetical protein TGGT1_307790 [Toxoplasma gondii GT1]|uniref:Uncharacterized protein n=5 Tax=Toxoplasma gondii TaxID=5811 RepID=B9Q3H3_TOXGV|nr:hypothetical protein TGGT1_307790 [Toxoplasma gondii GT1]ESS28343.1 hypothetical protein TGVEG_307790 [Toxoplasma gondii VEG]KFG28713.1 hypothetical protein TGP89_307790 [Toxoplasma gondii p89]KFG32962.1 hypothetical protein TGFOU_307790 [Toxoplasma gondii FOU]RQX71598.1 hypothetical protein TGCAST_307790 [Toxoplasma gondii CAST]
MTTRVRPSFTNGLFPRAKHYFTCETLMQNPQGRQSIDKTYPVIRFSETIKKRDVLPNTLLPCLGVQAKPPGQVLADIIQRWQMPWPVENVTDPVEAEGITYDGTVSVSWKTLTEVCRSEQLFVYVPSTLFETVSTSDFFDYEQSVLPRQFPLRAAVCYINIPHLGDSAAEKEDDACSGALTEKHTEGDCCRGGRPRRRCTSNNIVVRPQFSPFPVLLEFDAHPPIPQADDANIQPVHPAEQMAPAPYLRLPKGTGGQPHFYQGHRDAQADTMPTHLGGSCLVQSAHFFLPEGKNLSPQVEGWERLACQSIDVFAPLLGPEMRNAVAQGVELWRARERSLIGGRETAAGSLTGKTRELYTKEADCHLAFSSFPTYPTKGHALEMCAGPRFLTLDASCRAVTQLNLCQGRHAFFFWLDSPAGSSAFRMHWLPDKREKNSTPPEPPPHTPAGGTSAKSIKKQTGDIGTFSKDTDTTEPFDSTSCHIFSVEEFLETFYNVHIDEFLVTAPESTLSGPNYTVWFKAVLEIHSRLKCRDPSPVGGNDSTAKANEPLEADPDLPAIFVTLNLPHGGLAPYLRMSIGQMRTQLPGKLENPAGGKFGREGNSSDFCVLPAEGDMPATGERTGAVALESELRELPICPMLRIDLHELTTRKTDWQDQAGSDDGCTASHEQVTERSQSYLLLLESALPSPMPRVTFSVGIGARGLEVNGLARKGDRQRKPVANYGKPPQSALASTLRIRVDNIAFRSSWTDQTQTNGGNIVLRERIIPKTSTTVSASLRVTTEKLEGIVLYGSILEIEPQGSSQQQLQERAPNNFVQTSTGSGLNPVTPRQQHQQSRAHSNASPYLSGSQPRVPVANEELLSPGFSQQTSGKNGSIMSENSLSAMSRSSCAPTPGRYPTPPLEETLTESVGRDTVIFPHIQLNPRSTYVIQVVARKYRPVTQQNAAVPSSQCAPRPGDEWDGTRFTCPSDINSCMPSWSNEECWPAEQDEQSGVVDKKFASQSKNVELIHLAETASAERLRMAAPLDGGSWRLDVVATGEIEVAQDVCRAAFENQLLSFWNERDSSRAERARRSRMAFMARKMKQRDFVLSDLIDPPEALHSLAAFRQTVLWKLEMTEVQLLCLLARGACPPEPTDDCFSPEPILSEDISAAAFAQCQLLQDATEATETELQEFFFCELDPTRTGTVKSALFLMSLQSGAAMRSARKDFEERTASNRQARTTKGGNCEKKSKSGGPERDTKRPGAAQKSPASKLSKGDDQKRESQQPFYSEAQKESNTAYSCVTLRQPLTTTRHRNLKISQFLSKIGGRLRERAVTVPGVFRMVQLGLTGEQRTFAAASKATDARSELQYKVQEKLAALRESIDRISTRKMFHAQEERGVLTNWDPVAEQREFLRSVQRKRRDVASKVTEILQEETQKEIRKEELQQLLEECHEIQMWFFDSCLMQRLRNQHTAATAMHRAQEIIDKDAHSFKKDSDTVRKLARRRPEKESQNEAVIEKKDNPLTDEDVDELDSLLQTLQALYTFTGAVRPLNSQKASAFLDTAREALSAMRARSIPSKMSSPRQPDKTA